MRRSLRFILPLVFVLAVIAYFVSPLVDKMTLRWFVRDLDTRSRFITNTLSEPLMEILQSPSHSKTKILTLFNRATQDERLYAMAFCDVDNQLKYKTNTFPKEISCLTEVLIDAEQSGIIELATGPLHIAAQPVVSNGIQVGRLVLVHDMSFIERRSADTKKYVFYLFTFLGILVSLITVVIAQLSWRGWLAGMRSLLQGELLVKPLSDLRSSELLPLAKDLRALIKDLDSDRKARDESQLTWTPQTLKTILQRDLSGDEVLIVSNREPYIHSYKGDSIEVRFPASGVVTALEPIMRACSGTWIAHGGGSADRDVVDVNDRIRVPPDDPSYTIRRVWLTHEQEAGYYYGFANEGLWPLCHIAHTRPVFRSSDWEQYKRVNQKFCSAVLEEAKTNDPVILIQDYHFALLPRLIRDKMPDATIICFWHIPWPNPEAFGICPWREEILDGMLGSHILGFHTRYHGNNFIDTIDRFMEARIDQETSTVSYHQQLTAIKHYPISIEWPPPWPKRQKPVSDCRQEIRESNSLPSDISVGIGVDRLDYTKGILERFMAIERFLELHPQWIGRFSFIQIAAPSRSQIEEYHQFEARVRSLADKVNQRFEKNSVKPIILKIEHHDPNSVYRHYRGGDFCMVTSLHDGMNLVAKEFVAARDDERGTLILSQFTGASRELPEALLVNPYDIEQCAMAIEHALAMSPKEQRARMKSMRGLIQEFNVYRWAGRMLVDASRMRQRSRLLGRFGDGSLRSTGVLSL